MIETKVSINVLVDAHISELATDILARIGLTKSTAIDLFLGQVVSQGCLPFQSEAISASTLDEQVLAALESKNIPTIELEVDENGHVLIDKDLHPELYDWAVNG